MVVISHKYKFIVFKSYKTASSTIESFLGSVVKKNSKPREYIVGSKKMSDGKVITKHITPDELFIIMPEIKDYFKVCSIRNPFSQIVSCYIHNNKHIPNENQLKNYIKRCIYKSENHFKTIKKQHQHLRTYFSYILCEQKECIDFLIKQESLKDDLLKLLKKFKIKKFNVNRIGNLRKSKISYQINDIYSENNIKLVKKIFKEELQLGNYDFPINKTSTSTLILETPTHIIKEESSTENKEKNDTPEEEKHIIISES